MAVLDEAKAAYKRYSERLNDAALSASQPRRPILVEEVDVADWCVCPSCGEEVLLGGYVDHEGGEN